MRLPAKLVSERDVEIYRAKMQGMSFRQIADLFKISPSTAHEGFNRYLKKVAKQNSTVAVDAVWMHVEQLDQLMLNLMPMTREHKIETPDGEEITVPPNADAIKTVLQIMRDKAKILRYEDGSVTINVGTGGGVPALMPGGETHAEVTPEHKAKELGAEMLRAGVLSGPIAELLEKHVFAQNTDTEIVDAEIIEELEVLEIEEPKENIPPPWLEDDDEEYIPGSWVPDETQSGAEYNER